MGDAPVVSLTVWGVPARAVPGALARMATHRRPVAAAPGLRFAKLLGTGRGRTFTLRDADPRHWALLTVWDDERAADAFATGAVHRSWEAIAAERLDVRMTPLASRGSWSGREPFTPAGPTTVATSLPVTGTVAAITRARIRPTRALTFRRAVPPVVADLTQAGGLRLAFGIGEAPVGLQATFSLWESAVDLRRFAYAGAAHADVVRRTGPERWYAEELFARFAVQTASGSFGGRSLGMIADGF